MRLTEQFTYFGVLNYGVSAARALSFQAESLSLKFACLTKTVLCKNQSIFGAR